MFSIKRGVFSIKEGKNGASDSRDSQTTSKMVQLTHPTRGTAIQKDPLAPIGKLRNKVTLND
jgi:hypothetical protein